MATPHNSANPGQIAKSVLLPGDPLRAKFIAENFLTDPEQFNSVRGILGYTGTYNGKPISVMATGMGCPSIGIYTYELIHFYGVENLIRIGSCGALQPDMQLGDIVMAQGSCTDSNYAAHLHLPGQFCAIADFGLLVRAKLLNAMISGTGSGMSTARISSMKKANPGKNGPKWESWRARWRASRSTATRLQGMRRRLPCLRYPTPW